jgi:hypothetical protein
MCHEHDCKQICPEIRNNSYSPEGAIALARGACSDGLVRTSSMLIKLQYELRK